MEEIISKEIQDVLRKFGIYELNEVQRKAIPLIKSGKNVLIVSPTGSGKTEAAIIPIIEKIHSTKPKGIFAIYITPLRSLNRDMLRRIEGYCSSLNINVSIRHGDTPQHLRAKMVKKPPQLLITTPETLQIMLSGEKLRRILRNVGAVVVDEVHELAMDERGAQLTVVLERLKALAGKFQRIGLSATVANIKEVAEFIAGGEEIVPLYVPMGKRYETRVVYEEDSSENIAKEIAADIGYAAAIKTILDEVDGSNATLIFVNTRRTAEDLAQRIRILGREDIAVHHGSLSREVRIEVEEKFKRGELKALICTSSMELGIDIGHVDKVIQFNSPRQVFRLIQRVGRASHRIDEVSKGVIVGYEGDELEESMVIAKLLAEGFIERTRIRKNVLSALANQIIGEARSSRRIHARELYRIIRRSYVFRELGWEEFENLVNFLASLNLIRYDGEYISMSRRSLDYFYENISMIPDEKSYRVRDIRGKYVGTIDERFATFLEEGDIFLIGGKSWRVLQFGDYEIRVEEVDYIAHPPKWVGEEIPVEYSVAVELGKLRREGFTGNFVSSDAKNKIEEWRKVSGFNDRRISIGRCGDSIILLGCFGTKTSLTLSLLLSSMLAARFGAADYDYGTYYVRIFIPAKVKIEDVIDTIESIRPDAVEEILKITSKNTRFFHIVFLYVAKKFGIIRKGADIKSVRIEKIAEAYKDTPVYTEAINKLFHDYLDIDALKDILRKIRNGEIEFREIKNCNEVLRYIGREESKIVLTENVVKRVKERLLEEDVVQLCLSCGFLWQSKVRDVTHTCKLCGSVLVTILPKYRREKAEEVREIIRNNKKIPEKLRKVVDEMFAISTLLRRHGYRAAMCIAGRGIGFRKAVRILQIPYDSDEELVKKIMEAEIEYARTRRYWDI